MSIKSDKWIRRMAEQHKHDRALRAGQVREVNGHKIVSYGTSSYGYDIRCSQRIQAVHQHQLDHRRSEELRPEFLRRDESPTSASSRRIPSRWPARSSTSASRATC
jgi:deoxycytidine triphosphate deaminase